MITLLAGSVGLPPNFTGNNLVNVNVDTVQPKLLPQPAVGRGEIARNIGRFG